MDFRVLAVGDVVGNPGLEQIRRNLRQMKRQYHADFVVVNGENAAVVGITPNQADSILDAGADIITMGKPMGNGFPVAGVVVAPDVVTRFGQDTRYFNTFGGNSVAIDTVP